MKQVALEQARDAVEHGQSHAQKNGDLRHGEPVARVHDNDFPLARPDHAPEPIPKPEEVSTDALKVLTGIELATGRLNTSEEDLLANIAASIRRGLPQIRTMPVRSERVVLLGSGPSLETHVTKIRDLLFDGAKLVTTNGAYHWAIAHNFRPSMQIVIDGRAFNARFVEPAVPQCKYVLASQCHPATFDAVDGRDAWIFHAVDPDGVTKDLLDDYYLERWQAIAGGTTVIMRGLCMLRTIGYLRFDLFGVDSCLMDGQSHAFAQPENERDKIVTVNAHPDGHPELGRQFHATPWMLKQVEDFLQIIRVNGDHFLLHVHGDGLLAHVLETNAALTTE